MGLTQAVEVAAINRAVVVAAVAVRVRVVQVAAAVAEARRRSRKRATIHPAVMVRMGRKVAAAAVRRMVVAAAWIAKPAIAVVI
jgi:hypothetical protein